MKNSENKPVTNTPLNPVKHQQLKFDTSAVCDVLQDQYLVPISLHEFAFSALSYPVFFVKNEDTGAFQAVAMMGTEPGENLYCKKGVWTGLYLPETARYAPFSLGLNAANDGDYFICVNENSRQIGIEKGEALFDGAGQQTKLLAEISEALVRQVESMKFAISFIAHLADLDVLSPQSLTLNLAGKKQTIGGVYVVDADKLSKLSVDDFEQLRQQGVLPTLYAHMNSLGQIARLIRRKNEAEK